MSFSRRNTLVLTWVMMLSAQGEAAEFSQVRPDADALMQLPVTEWLTNGGDLYNRNFSPLDQINTDNVGRLGPVWRTHLNGSGLEAKYSGEAQPLIIDGIMYVITGADDVFALSVETGEMLWSNEAQLSSEISTICCGWTSRGVGYGEDKILWASSMVC